MNNHPLNLLIRFCLELALLAITGFWAWQSFDGVLKYIISIGLPLLIAIIWGVFRVDGDPKKAIISIPGWLRLLFEILVFGLGVYFLFDLNFIFSAYIFLSTSVIHYLVSFDRIKWLLHMKKD